MNNFPIPYFPINNIDNLIREINNIKEEVYKINQRLDKIENEKNNKYLKKDDNYYMI